MTHPRGEPLDVREGYEGWASSYDAYDNPLVRLEEPVVIELVGDVHGKTVADIGCGTGRHAARLARAGARVTGVDASPSMLAELRRKAPEVQVIEHDLAGGLPLPSASFQVVSCCLVLEHVAALDDAVAELARICTRAGIVVVTDLHPELTRRGIHARFRDAGGDKRQIVGFHHTVSAYVLAAARAGLHIEDLREQVMDVASAQGSASAQKYVGEPLLFAMKLSRP